MILTMDPSLMPIAQLYVSSDLPLDELNKIIEDDIPSIERSGGCFSVSFGGTEKEISVKFNQERLAGYGLTLSDISQMLAAEISVFQRSEASRS